MLPLVSVIIPVYNVRPYLREALDSVINQTYTNLEIIVIDDGSTDGSGKICDQYQKKDKRIRVIHQENRGLSAARNAGLDVMNGQYVAFLDSDDAFMQNAIDVMLKKIVKLKADIAVCGYYICKTNSKMHTEKCVDVFRVDNDIITSKEALNRLFSYNLGFAAWNKLYNSILFKGVRFPNGCVYEDHILMPFLIKGTNRIATIDQPLVLYRKRPRSITSSFNKKNELDWLLAVKVKERFILKHTPLFFNSKQAKQHMERIFREIIMHLLLCMFQGDSTLSSTKLVLQQEMVKRKRSVNNYSLKTRIVYRFYKINPYACYCLMRLNHNKR